MFDAPNWGLPSVRVPRNISNTINAYIQTTRLGCALCDRLWIVSGRVRRLFAGPSPHVTTNGDEARAIRKTHYRRRTEVDGRVADGPRGDECFSLSEVLGRGNQLFQQADLRIPIP